MTLSRGLPGRGGPQDPTLRFRLEATDHLDTAEPAAIQMLIGGTLRRHQARPLAAS